MSEARRLVQVRIALDVLGVLLTVGRVPICVKGLPDGSRLVGMDIEGFRRILLLTYEHESFEPVAEGSPIPELEMLYRDEA